MKHILKSLILFIIFAGCSTSNNVISQTDITASNSSDDSKQVHKKLALLVGIDDYKYNYDDKGDKVINDLE